MEDKYTGFMISRKKIYETRDKCPLDGDIPVIRFINTLHRRGTEQRKEYLNNYDNFLDWAYDAKIIEEPVYTSLCFESYCYGIEAAEIFERVINFRACLYDLVICLMDGVAPYPELISSFNGYFNEVKQHRSLNMNGYGMEEVWVNTHEQITFPLWKIVKWGAELLATVDGAFIKRCKCGNLFIDRSKNGKRRWCNPATCGSAYWSKEYYGRKKAVASC